MANRKTRRISPYADSMGRFIGQLRDHEGVTLKQLSRGLCEPSFLNKIENGDREAGKLLTDAFFQRLGKPVELFERILDHEEFVKWTQRQEIISHLRGGRVAQARSCARRYPVEEHCVLDKQFLAIVEIDCLALEGIPAGELLPMVEKALLLTQPDFGSAPFDTLLLSQNEGRLLFAHLRLREELEGQSAVAGEYRALMNYFKHKRYESRERVYLFPYVACRVIENDYRAGNFAAALAVCEDALAELTREKRLFAYDCLLAWKQKLFDAMGNPDRTPGRILAELREILKMAPERAELLIPCEEQGHVYSLNQVIRDRRNLLGLSQEEISDDACGLRSVSRIENEDRKVQRKNRKKLLQKVNMSGERYDYEIISERYEDYLLRSELDRAINNRNMDEAERLLSILKERVPQIPTNEQYILKKEAAIMFLYVNQQSNELFLEKHKKKLEEAIALTLPLDLQEIESWPVSVLTVNEILSLMMYAVCYKRQEEHQKSLAVLLYVQKCLENTNADISYYEDLYTRLGLTIAVTLRKLGKYEESKEVAMKCLGLSLENYNSRRLARYVYTVACNIEVQAKCRSEENHEQSQQEALQFYEQAYILAKLLNDDRGQQYIKAYCEETYSEKF